MKLAYWVCQTMITMKKIPDLFNIINKLSFINSTVSLLLCSTILYRSTQSVSHWVQLALISTMCAHKVTWEIDQFNLMGLTSKWVCIVEHCIAAILYTLTRKLGPMNTVRFPSRKTCIGLCRKTVQIKLSYHNAFQPHFTEFIYWFFKIKLLRPVPRKYGASPKLWVDTIDACCQHKNN